MLEDAIWNKLEDWSKISRPHVLCWDCMEKRFKAVFKRDLKIDDFKRHDTMPFNMGNPEIKKLRRSPLKTDIKIFARVHQLIGDPSTYVLETSVHKDLGSIVPEEFEKGKDLNALIHKAKKYIVENKKKYPDAIVELEILGKKMAGSISSENNELPKAKNSVDGLIVRKHIPNISSISSSLTKYRIHDGVREIPLSEFSLTGKSYSVTETNRIESLANAIKESGEINPLIVVHDDQGYYILEGGHRAEALYLLKKKTAPALIVDDLLTIPS
jgi:hypothetical protein